ncbi:hypothetical protein XBJ2_2750003 [Xenorhabdus bovienii str. Jollieti]|uniref:Uncharacterized protein n=1 Tax=Xenorhabdus bovienii (strain SS-2004) TaxID=406818 RepID=D3V052_XENBS|nr:hypothetical protein XBJ1_1475 [Xenorhabdus bovienii SS-2004]CDH29471.1 hypothetical protein XBJ2_2750003 [Xenorhabdus bovienii str. Jollieti]
MFDFVQLGLLGGLNGFGKYYARSIENEGTRDLLVLGKLLTLIEPQILRHIKEDVARDWPQQQNIAESIQQEDIGMFLVLVRLPRETDGQITERCCRFSIPAPRLIAHR